MVINIRGTSGSGKTTAVRQLLNLCGVQTQCLMDGKVLATSVVLPNGIPLFAIGSYASVCGGCDTMHTQDMICSVPRYYSQFGHVVFEGMIFSSTWARYAALNDEFVHMGIEYVWLYLDTPLEMCLENVRRRRAARGVAKKEFNPTNTISKYHGVIKTMDLAMAAGYDVRTLHYAGDTAAQLLDVLCSSTGYALWDDCYREWNGSIGGHV